MFDDERFDKYQYEDIPLNRDCYLVDEKYAAEYEYMYLRAFNGQSYDTVGYVSYISVIAIHENSLEISWFPNIYDRFHEVTISLPRNNIKRCVGCWQWDWKPTIFVESCWIEDLYAKKFSVFGMVDVDGIRQAIQDNFLSREKLLEVRAKIDNLSSKYREVAFISFADSILIKSNWTVGSVHSGITYSYRIEYFIEIAQHFKAIFQEALGLNCYMILTQGYNEYYDDELLHISKTKNHISLNSLGIPFAQIFSIENSVREALREGTHPRYELYMDHTFYQSLLLKYEYKKIERPKAQYKSIMSTKPAHYYYDNIQTIADNLMSNTGLLDD